jgi:DNA invertase Pin-like site-specific DNA recombinase
MSEFSQPLALLYTRVSTVDQAVTGASLDAQREALVSEAERRGWRSELITETGSGKSLCRPQLADALRMLDAGKADYLVSARLDRVSRSVADFAGLVERAQRRSWGLLLLSPALDLTDPAGRFTANVLASAAQYERELLSQRTREGMAQRQAEGVVMGRPVSPRNLAIHELVHDLAASGLGPTAIAGRLNADGIPTLAGGRAWYPATARAVLASVSRRKQRARAVV